MSLELGARRFWGVSRRRLTSLGVTTSVAEQIAARAGSAAARVMDQRDGRVAVKGDEGMLRWQKEAEGYRNGLTIPYEMSI